MNRREALRRLGVGAATIAVDQASAPITILRSIGGIVLFGGAEKFLGAETVISNIQSVLKPAPPYDAIVVLGAGNAAGSTILPSPDGALRLIAGAHQYQKQREQRYPTKLILSGGSTIGETEADAMKNFLLANFTKKNGIYTEVSQNDIILERVSIDTVSEIHQIMLLLSQHPEFKKVAIVTNHYHMVGAQALGKNLNVDLYPIVAEECLREVGDPEIQKRVDDFYNDAGIKGKIQKEKERIVMLLFDPQSHFSHERFYHEADPKITALFALAQAVLTEVTIELSK